jgi:hypothetical protein
MVCLAGNGVGAALAVCALGMACVEHDAGHQEAPPAEVTPPPPDASPGEPLSVPGVPYLGCLGAGDCAGADCVPITDGFSACAYRQRELDAGLDPGRYGECGPDQPCETGTCLTLSTAAANRCTPGGFDITSSCIGDECSSDADCPNGGLCAPAGVAGTSKLSAFPRRRCLTATCKSNADCTAKPGGICGMIRDECMPITVQQWGFRDARVACIYPDGCTTNSGCSAGYCDVLDGAATCLLRASKGQ